MSVEIKLFMTLHFGFFFFSFFFFKIFEFNGRFPYFLRGREVFKLLKGSFAFLQIFYRKVQFIFAGKAHPHDDGGKMVIQRLIQASREMRSVLPIVYLEGYDMALSSVLTAGVDLWLNNPKRPREASGTSGMKCTHNGVMNFSVLDGWWIEGWVEDVTGWSIGPEPAEADLIEYDEMEDAIDLYAKLKEKILPTYYENRGHWISMMKRTIALNASYFNTHRVVKDYCEKAYGIVFRGM